MRRRKSKDKYVQEDTNQGDTYQSKSSQSSIVHFTGECILDLKLIKQEIGHNSDVQFREFNIGRTGIQAAIIFTDGLSDKELIDKYIMKSLMNDFWKEYKQKSVSKEFIRNQVLSISEITEVHCVKELIP